MTDKMEKGNAYLVKHFSSLEWIKCIDVTKTSYQYLSEYQYNHDQNPSWITKEEFNSGYTIVEKLGTIYNRTKTNQ